MEHADLEGWLKKNLCAIDHVVIESTTNAWVKTDIRDTLILARLLAANLVPEVWVPPVNVREMRQLLSQRKQLVETHTQIVNRMHSVAHRHHLQHERGKRFNDKTIGWQKDKKLSSLEQFQLALEMENLTYIQKEIERISQEVRKMCHRKPNRGQRA